METAARSSNWGAQTLPGRKKNDRVWGSQRVPQRFSPWRSPSSAVGAAAATAVAYTTTAVVDHAGARATHPGYRGLPCGCGAQSTPAPPPVPWPHRAHCCANGGTFRRGSGGWGRTWLGGHCVLGSEAHRHSPVQQFLVERGREGFRSIRVLEAWPVSVVGSFGSHEYWSFHRSQGPDGAWRRSEMGLGWTRRASQLPNARQALPDPSRGQPLVAAWPLNGAPAASTPPHAAACGTRAFAGPTGVHERSATAHPHSCRRRAWPHHRGSALTPRAALLFRLVCGPPSLPAIPSYPQPSLAIPGYPRLFSLPAGDDLPTSPLILVPRPDNYGLLTAYGALPQRQRQRQQPRLRSTLTFRATTMGLTTKTKAPPAFAVHASFAGVRAGGLVCAASTTTATTPCPPRAARRFPLRATSFVRRRVGTPLAVAPWGLRSSGWGSPPPRQGAGVHAVLTNSGSTFTNQVPATTPPPATPIVASAATAPVPYDVGAFHDGAADAPDAIPSSRIRLASASSADQLRFRRTRLRIFCCIGISYAVYVLLRSNFTFVAPLMRAELGLSLAQIGAVSSVFPFAYGGSRLVTGIVADRRSPRATLAFGLLAAGLANVALAFCRSVPTLCIMYAINGLVQGAGSGACARLLTAWYPTEERGVWWALWSTSANFGAFAAPLLCGLLSAGTLGWRAGLLVPGLLAVALAVLTLPLMRDTPGDAGWSVSWPQPAPTTPPKRARAVDGGAGRAAMTTSGGGGGSATAAAADGTPSRPAWRETVERVITSRSIWTLAAASFLLYFVRQALKTWLPFALVEVKHFDAAQAAVLLSTLELSGVAGAFSSGVASDAAGGRRAAVTLVYLAVLIVALVGAALCPPGGTLATAAALAALGFCVNGPQVLIGLIGAEVSGGAATATALGFLGVVSYTGAAFAGWPLTLVIKAAGWPAFFAVLLAATAACAGVLLPMWRLRDGARSR